jgi:hypothetical protein
MRCSLTATKITVDPDEPFELVCVIENTGLIPMSLVRVQLRLPALTNVDEAASRARGLHVRRPVIQSEPVVVESSHFIMPRRKLECRFAMSLPRRGRFLMQSVQIQHGDFFGFRTEYGSLSCLAEVVALPRRAERSADVDALGGTMGEVSVRRFIMEDPVLTLGFREYTGAEPQKMISWSQSARAGRMMVKKYDYTIEPAATVLLNAEEGGEGADPQLLERCFSLTRSVCELLEQRHIKYGFFTNSTAAGAFGLIGSVADGLGPGHLLAILEGLGRATYDITHSAGRLFDRAARKAEPGRCHILITPTDTEQVRRSMHLLRERTGGQTFIIAASGGRLSGS